MRSPISTIIIVIFCLGLGAAGGYFYNNWRLGNDNNNLKSRISQAEQQNTDLKSKLQICTGETDSSATKDNSSSKSTTSAADQTANAESAKKTVENYLEAKQSRLLANAKSYMTTSLYESMNTENFAGTSSPSMGRYFVQTSEYLPNADLYQVKARIYQNLNGQEVGYNDNTYLVASENSKFLVNEVKEGEWVGTE